MSQQITSLHQLLGYESYIDTILKNQLTFVDNVKHMDPICKKVTPNAAARIFSNWHVDKIVGVQTLSSPIEPVYHLEYRTTENGEISLDLVSHTAEAGSRKLDAAWSPEYLQDMQFWFRDDTTNSLAEALSVEITEELTTEVVLDLKQIATWKGKRPNTFWRDDQHIPRHFGFTPKNYPYNVMRAITTSRSSIAINTKRGAGNFAILGKKAFSAIIAGVNNDMAIDVCIQNAAFQNNVPLNPVGTMHGDQVNLYTSSVLEEDEIIVGYKGSYGNLDTGYIYCPYVPLMNNGVAINPITFQPLVKFMTRYAKWTAIDVEGPCNAANYYELIKI